MATNRYLQGNLARCFGAFNVGGTIVNGAFVGGTMVDPSPLSISIQPPGGAAKITASYPGTIIRDAVGMYHFDQDIEIVGVWYYDYVTPNGGTNQVLCEGSFIVDPRHA